MINKHLLGEYPRVNDSATMQKEIANFRRAAYLVVLGIPSILIGLLAFIISYLWKD